MKHSFVNYSTIRLFSYIFGLLLFVVPSFLYAGIDNTYEDDPSIPLDARLHYKSGVFWFEQGDYKKAHEMFKHAFDIYPGKDAKKIMKNIKAIIEKKERLEQQKFAEHQEAQRLKQEKQNAEIVRQLKASDKTAIQEQNDNEGQNQQRQEVDAERQKNYADFEKNRKLSIAICQRECRINNYQFEKSCYNSCMYQHGFNPFLDD